MFIEILLKILLFKGGVLIYAEHCIYISHSRKLYENLLFIISATVISISKTIYKLLYKLLNIISG